MEMSERLEYYLSLPYHVELVREDAETWFARVRELPGCITEGDTPEEAARMIRDAMSGWIEIALEDGREIPEPRTDEQHSGKFVVRVPKSLHRELVERAESEGVSLNQYVNVALARAVSEPIVVRASRDSESEDEETVDPTLRSVLQAFARANRSFAAAEFLEACLAATPSRDEWGVMLRWFGPLLPKSEADELRDVSDPDEFRRHLSAILDARRSTISSSKPPKR